MGAIAAQISELSKIPSLLVLRVKSGILNKGQYLMALVIFMIIFKWSFVVLKLVTDEFLMSLGKTLTIVTIVRRPSSTCTTHVEVF